MDINSEFIPAKGLRNPDLQTLFPTLARMRTQVAMRSERLELADGDFLDLEWVGSGDGPIVLILHGMAGNATSPYIKGIMQEIIDRGWRGVMMYFRGCSHEINRLPVTYHFGRTEDFGLLLQHVKQKFPNAPLYATGFSMGGNVLLKWLGENSQQTDIHAAVAISAPYDLRSTSIQIRQGKGRVYQWLLMRDIKRFVNKKYNYPHSPVAVETIDKIKSFWDLDDKLTAPINGFKDAVEYYNQTSCKPWLPHITTNTLIIHALDDPMIPANTLPSIDTFSATTHFELSQHGGHVGFVAGSLSQPIYWTDSRIMDYLTQQHIQQQEKSQGNKTWPKSA